jgi:hypothetical protein
VSKHQKDEEDINDSEEEDRMMRSLRPRFPQARPLLRVDTGFALAGTPVTKTPFAPTFPLTTGPTFDYVVYFDRYCQETLG